MLTGLMHEGARKERLTESLKVPERTPKWTNLVAEYWFYKDRNIQAINENLLDPVKAMSDTMLYSMCHIIMNEVRHSFFVSCSASVSHPSLLLSQSDI